MKHITILGVLGTWFLLSACMATQGRSEKLKEAVFYFNEGVRWGRIQDVLSRLDPAAESHFIEMHKEFGRTIKVTGYEVTSTQIDLKKGTATIGIKIAWYRIDQMEVHETILIQHWYEKDHNWLMSAEEYIEGQPF